MAFTKKTDQFDHFLKYINSSGQWEVGSRQCMPDISGDFQSDSDSVHACQPLEDFYLLGKVLLGSCYIHESK